MRNCYIFLANGFEPLEALAPMDILRRGKVNVKFVSLTEDCSVNSTQGYSFSAELCWSEFLKESEAEGIECMIFPGGLPGADNLGTCEPLMKIMKEHFAEGKLTCAICAAPARVLAANLQGQIDGRSMTAYKGFEGELAAAGAQPTEDGVTVDGNLITGKGPGLAMDFGFAILTALKGEEVTKLVKAGMML